MKGELRKLFLVGLALVDIATACPAPAQSACGEPQVADYFEPLTDGEGVRYPVTIGPLSWRLMGYLQPVKGSDGLIHLAYTLQFTNSWSSKATVKSIEVVDPARNNAATGKNQVVTVKNEDVTGELRLLSLRATLDKANYTTEIPSGQSAIGYFDVTYSDASQVPRAIAHRVTVSALGQQQKAQDFNTLSPPITGGLPRACHAGSTLQRPWLGQWQRMLQADRAASFRHEFGQWLGCSNGRVRH